MEKKKGAGGKLSRSEIIQARLNPKLKFAAEIIANHERRTLSSLIETAMEVYAKTCRLNLEINGIEEIIGFDDLLEKIWDPHAAIRYVKTGLINPNLLGLNSFYLWDFIKAIPYFWAHYEVTYRNKKNKIMRKVWEPYEHTDGIISEHLIKYWDLIQTEEGRDQAISIIPDEIGKKIPPPPGSIVSIYEEFDDSLPFDRNPAVERHYIWRNNIQRLLRSDFEIVETPNGKENRVVFIYPTPEEQMEMVEKIYQEKIKCQSNSQK